MSEALVTLSEILAQVHSHPNNNSIIQHLTRTREDITYHGIVSSPTKYLCMKGLSKHNKEEFEYIGDLIALKIGMVADKIEKLEVPFYDIEKYEKKEKEEKMKKMKEENEEESHIYTEVMNAVDKIDYPISLFKRQDNYWYQDNPKTKLAQEFIKQKAKEESERRKKIQSEREKSEEAKLKEEQDRVELEAKLNEERKIKHKEEVKNRIEVMKREMYIRQKKIDESKNNVPSRPLFKMIQENEQKKLESELEIRKRKLIEIRSLNKSVDMGELIERRNRLAAMEKEREFKKVFDAPMKVSFKSSYHQDLSSNPDFRDLERSHSLYEKRQSYGNHVKNDFKPQIDEKLVQELEQRVKILKRKRVRKNIKKANHSSGSDSDSNSESDSSISEKLVKKNNDDSSSESDSDSSDSEKLQRKRGDDEEPGRKERYKMGVEYLQSLRRMKKKERNNKSMENTSNVGDSLKETKSSSRYRNYLGEFSRTNRSKNNELDTSKMDKLVDKGNHIKEETELSKLENEIRIMENKVSRQEELMKVRKMKNSEAYKKKAEIDNAVFTTIKARLAMLGS